MNTPNSLYLNLLHYHIWGAMLELEKYLLPKPKMTDGLKVALQTICVHLPQEHINKVVANFTKHLTACVCATGRHFEQCSSSAHLQVCILISSRTNWLFYSHQQTTREDHAQKAEK